MAMRNKVQEDLLLVLPNTLQPLHASACREYSPGKPMLNFYLSMQKHTTFYLLLCNLVDSAQSTVYLRRLL